MISDHKTLGALESVLRSRESIVLAYLFGSAARGEASPQSDLDVGVLLEEGEELPLREQGRLVEELAAAADVDRADVVLLAEASPTLAARVLRDGLILLCRDQSARVSFETRALGEYMDTEAIRRNLDRARLREIREGRFLG